MHVLAHSSSAFCPAQSVRGDGKRSKQALCSAHPLYWTALGLLPFVPPLHSSVLQLSGPWSFALASLGAHSLLGVGKLEAWRRESPKLHCAAPWPAQAAVHRDVTPGAAAGRLAECWEIAHQHRHRAGYQGEWEIKRDQAILGEVSVHFKSPPPNFCTCTHSSKASYSPGFFLDQLCSCIAQILPLECTLIYGKRTESCLKALTLSSPEFPR